MQRDRKPLTDQQRKLIEDHAYLAHTVVFFLAKRSSSPREVLNKHYDRLHDAVTTTLVCAARRYDPAKGSKFSSYVYRGAIMRWRASELRRWQQDALDVSLTEIDAVFHNRRIEQIEAKEVVDYLLGKLHPHHRDVVQRCLLDDEQQTEIARERGHTKSAVNNSLTTALKRLHFLMNAIGA